MFLAKKLAFYKNKKKNTRLTNLVLQQEEEKNRKVDSTPVYFVNNSYQVVT